MLSVRRLPVFIWSFPDEFDSGINLANLTLCVSKDCGAQLFTALEPFLVCSLILDQFAMGDSTGAQGTSQDTVAIGIHGDTQNSKGMVRGEEYRTQLFLKIIQDI